jgi:beta-glucosidase
MTREEWLKASAMLAAGAMLPKGLMAKLIADEELKRSDFGRDFIWGTATAAYQIEGAWDQDGKGESIWDHFTHTKKNKIKTRENGDVACDFYHKYESDIELMRKMNIPASRFSIGWSRVLPGGTGTPNQKGIDFYNRLIDKCLKENVEPWVTCYHWDLPQALQEKGGWVNRDSIKWFEEYVDLCGRSFGDRVKDWMVFNEPMAFTGLGYLLGIHAPGKFGYKTFFPAVHHAVMSHGAGGRALRNTVKGANIGTTFSCSPVDAWKDTRLNADAVRRSDVLINRLFIEPILGMGYATKDLPALWRMEKYMKEDDAQKMAFDFDFIGVQNYTRIVAKYLGIVPMLHALNINPKKLGHPITEMNWEVYPEGIYQILKQFAAYPNIKKLIVTENGAAFKDENIGGAIHDAARTKFIQDYLKQVLRAKKEGVNVGGYFVWSFLDNFEWAEGYRPRFGMVGVDFKTQERTIKDSGKWFAEFLKG